MVCQLPNLFTKMSLYCHALSGQVICFTGFKKREELVSIKSLINFMGGRVRKEMNSETTHLIAKVCKGEKYSYAMLFNVPVVSETWIYDAWKCRNEINFNAADADFVSKYKLKLFYGSRICFLGFQDDEKSHMIEVLKENGGEPVDVTDATCTHMVVDDAKISVAPPLKSNKTFAVKAEWFWSSIQFECHKNELEFKLETNNNDVTPISSSSFLSMSSSRARKRKIRREKFSIGVESPLSGQKRRSSVYDSTLSGASFLTLTSPLTNVNESIVSEKLKASKRYHKFMELWQTETNYVGILKTIMTFFKSELEAMVDTKDQLLNDTEIKIIFGGLTPIYEVHSRMLEDLSQLKADWNEDTCIGSLILKYSADLVKSYPPFINFFDTTREMLVKCDEKKPRFHAFLKSRQSRPECGRQSLIDLLIRPVQRLPSVNLLLNDILKSTAKDNIDYNTLEAAIREIQEVMNYINEDKKRTDGQVALFDIFNEIENCPADLVSSQRCFISRCEVTLRSGDLSGKGKPLVLFLFSDVIMICKKKIKTSSKENNIKKYKHILLIRLIDIIKVIDIKDTEDSINNFALIVKKEHSKEAEDVFSFTIADNSVKQKYLRTVCNQIANIFCIPDTESYLTEVEAPKWETPTCETNMGALNRALTFASETRKKVRRALSFRK